MLLILVLPWFPFQENLAQEERSSRTQTFAPLPSLMGMQDLSDGEALRFWEDQRRETLLQLFRDHMYGSPPDEQVRISSRLTSANRASMEGKAVMKQVEIVLERNGKRVPLNLLLYLPAESREPVPVFLGLNFFGNQSISDDPGISLAEGWVRNNEEHGTQENRVTERSRGTGSSRWPVEMILSHGYGLATLYAGDIDPDMDDGFGNGVHALFPEYEKERGPGSWGTLAAWAWGLSRVLDYLETDPDVDAGRVAVMGHSRMGKAALWAGASDPRFAMVVSNNSGCGGAALSRRAFGERVHQINERFPHWFAGRFHTYNHREEALPVDQHMLMALVAPRPLYVASAEEDAWADPYGEYLSLYHAGPAYALYGNPPVKPARLPGVDEPVRFGLLGYHIRAGGHDVTRFDWEQYLAFADRWLKEQEEAGIENPVTVSWISEHLAKPPRLVLTPALESELRDQLQQGDPLTTQGYERLLEQARSMLELEPLAYEKQGRRLLAVSREALKRLSTLALAYRLERDPRYLVKLEEELQSVCRFTDWNPSHFLDVAEMAAGVALALDWTEEWLSKETSAMARQSLISKALEPAVGEPANTWWSTTTNNWNLVCHGGTSLAALAVFEEVPDLAARVLHQAVDHLPLGLGPYAPSGVYPEGPSYWFYATNYLTLTIQAYETALGTSFGFPDAPGVMESAVFSLVLAGPSGDYYDYFDASPEGFESLEHFGLLSWFAARSGPGIDMEKYTRVLAESPGSLDREFSPRLYPVHFLYTAGMSRKDSPPVELPGIWTGWGEAPVAVMRDPEGGSDGFFLAAKGGRAADSHGNMDGGSFIFELDGVRWSVDPGNQPYHPLEQLMGNELWDEGQDSRRWSLLTKNNRGHSTLTINGEPHLAGGRATLLELETRPRPPRITFDLTPLYGNLVQRAHRSFLRTSDHSLVVRDEVQFSPETETLTWQMITRAEVLVRQQTVYMRQDGEELALYINRGGAAEIRVVDLDPPPLPYDKHIPDLKRVEIIWERSAFPGGEATLEVELNSNVQQRRQAR